MNIQSMEVINNVIDGHIFNFTSNTVIGAGASKGKRDIASRVKLKVRFSRLVQEGNYKSTLSSEQYKDEKIFQGR